MKFELSFNELLNLKQEEIEKSEKPEEKKEEVKVVKKRRKPRIHVQGWVGRYRKKA